MYRYQIIEKLFPHDIATIVYSFNCKKKEEIKQNFQRSLFCIEYYGIQNNLGNNIWRNNRLVPIRDISKGIAEYVMEELTQKNRNDTINMLRNYNSYIHYYYDIS